MRICGRFFFVALVILVLTVGAGAENAMQYGVVSASRLHLRSEPSKDAQSLGEYAKDTRLQILQHIDDWYLVITPDGQQGYMSAHYVTPLKTGPSASAHEAGTTQEVGIAQEHRVNNDRLSVSIAYPLLNCEVADSLLHNWIANTQFSAESMPDESVSIQVSYDAHWVDERYAGVLELGEMRAGESQGALLVYTLNVDMHTNTVLTYRKIFAEDRLEEVVELLEQQLSRQTGDAQWHLMPEVLQNTVLTAAGATVVIPVGGVADAHMVTLSYATLMEKGLISLEIETAPEDAYKPMVALTFDDGPGTPTEALLDVLKAYDVPATFFIVGNRARNYSQTLERIVQEGHEVATHTWSHQQLTDLTYNDAEKEITSSINAIGSVVDTPIALLRPPYGAVGSDVREICRRLGLAVVLWSIDTEDWRTNDADNTSRVILEQVKDGSIVLCHDLKSSTPAAMEKTIPILLERGYRLVTVSELLSYSSSGGAAGVIYTHVDTGMPADE